MDNIYLAIVDRNVGPEVVQTVNARDLHAFLGSKSEYSPWIKHRLDDFQENQDFIRLTDFSSGYRGGGHNRIEYYLTIDTAKHICMLERNEKGKQLRQYFIDVEKQARAKSASPVLPDLSTRRKAIEALLIAETKLEEEQNQRLLLAAQVEAQAPAVAFVETVANQGNDISFNVFAKEIGWKPMDLFKWARANKVLQTVNWNIAYQPLVNSGLFRIVEWVQNGRSGQQTLITGKGRIWLFDRLGIPPETPKPVMSQDAQDVYWDDENLA